MQSHIDATERARRLGNVAAILIDLGRKARLAGAADEEKATGQHAPAEENDLT